MKFLIVTACLNRADMIDETVMSVVSQAGDAVVRYHVQDGGSTDGTRERLAAWADSFKKGGWPILCRELRFSFASEPDSGLYEALNKGFARLIGENPDEDAMMSWINAGDRLAQGALRTVTAVANCFPDTRWLSGMTTQANDAGSIFMVGTITSIPQKPLAAGLFEGRRLGFVQQEGVFWRQALWQAAGGRLDDSLALAGDFDLWRRFAGHAPLVRVNTVTGIYRHHAQALGADRTNYYREVDSLISGEAAERRDRMMETIRDLAARGARAEMKKAGFAGPVMRWLTDRQAWGRAEVPLVVPDRGQSGRIGT